jgi:molybdopterin-guanine dinucleotide biosynthesis protein A
MMTGVRAWPPHQLLGAVLAGGESRRYGRPKAMALIGGRPMAQWALDALNPHFSMRGMVGNHPFVARAFGVPSRRDVMPGLGPLGGLITALEWAGEMRLRGAFVLGCDMPLVDPVLVGKILDFRGIRKGALVPASPGPLGMEPLCAAYSLDCLGPARELARSGRRSMKALLDSFDFDLIPLEDLGDPEAAAVAFTNVNTVADGMKVEAILEKRRKGVTSPDPEQGSGPR